MTQIPKKLEYATESSSGSSEFDVKARINQLIDVLHELTSRIDTIAGNQLEMKRGELAKDLPTEQKVERDIFGQWSKVPVDQPKRWRAVHGEKYWFVDSLGDVARDEEGNARWDNHRYNTANYFSTYEAAEAYKAKLLADNAQ